MVYKITEKDIEKNQNCDIKFETFHSDDFIQLELFQKNSIQKNSKIGKAFISLRELNCKQPVKDEDDVEALKLCVVPITFSPSNYGEKKLKVNGQIFLSVQYEGRPDEVFDPKWREKVVNISSANEKIDRYEHMNDFLHNDFTSHSQFGPLMI